MLRICSILSRSTRNGIDVCLLMIYDLTNKVLDTKLNMSSVHTPISTIPNNLKFVFGGSAGGEIHSSKWHQYGHEEVGLCNGAMSEA